MTPSPPKKRNWSQKETAPCCVCTCGEGSKHSIEDMMNLVLPFSQLKFLEHWLSQKRLPPCACTCGKRPKHFIEDMNFVTKQRCGTCPPSKQDKTRSRANCQCQQWEHLPALITFKFSTKITHTPGITTPGDFHPDRSGGHVAPT